MNIINSRLLLIFFTAIVFFSYTKSSFVRPTDDFKELLVYSFVFIGGLVFIWRKFKEKNHFYPTNLITISITLYCAYIFANIIFTQTTINEGLIQGGRAFLFLFGFVLVAQLKKETQFLLLKYTVVGGFLVLLLSLVLLKGTFTPIIRPIGHVSYYTDYLYLLVPIAVIYTITCFRNKDWLPFLTFWVFASSFGFAILLMARRSASLAYIIALLLLISIWFLCYRKREKFHYEWMVIISIFLITFSLTYLSSKMRTPVDKLKSPRTSISRFQKIADQVTAGEIKKNSRFVFFLRSEKAIEEKPILGWGYGSFKYTYPKFASKDDDQPALFRKKNPRWLMHPHNEALFHLYEGGIVGFSFYILFILGVGFYSYKLIFRTRDIEENDRLLAIGLAVAFAGIFISNQFNTTATNAVVKFVLIIYLGVFYSLLKQYKLIKEISLSIKLRKVVVLPLLLLVHGLFSFSSIGQSLSSYFLQQAKLEARKGKETKIHHYAKYLAPNSYDSLARSSTVEIYMGHRDHAIALLEKAIELYPYVPITQYRLAKLYFKRGDIKKSHEILIANREMYPQYEQANNLLEQVEQQMSQSQ